MAQNTTHSSDQNAGGGHGGGHGHGSHHYILPTKTAVTVFGCLLVLTAVTVWIAGVDLGVLNFPVAMLVATIKACLVAIIFMNLRNDRKENAVIFVTSFLFLVIFIVFTSADIFFRGDVYVRGPIFKAVAGGPAKFKQGWNGTPEMVAHGKEVFMAQCISCHGATGHGDGPAAAALNPPPRNFTADVGWKNGRKPTGIFKTLREGIPGTGMASYATLPQDDRWSLVHYVLSLGPDQPKATPEDLKAIGIDPASDGTGGEAQAQTIPIALAMKQVVEPAVAGESKLQRASLPADHPGASVYQEHCASCHGVNGQGGIKVTVMGAVARTYVETLPMSKYESMQSGDKFNAVVTHGIPGIMPAFGELSGGQLRDLQAYLR